MISIIICSRNKDISNKLKINIQNTIGILYEIIIIDNSKNKYSIFEAYNEGVRRSSYAYLCFMHDDILYHTNNWGKKVIDHFNNINLGLIGVLGTHFISKCPSYSSFSNMNSGIYIQDKLLNGSLVQELIEHRTYIKYDISIEAVTVDGLWFCVTKNMFDKIEFDTMNFSGFHGYDMDICLQVRENHKLVKVISDILIEHKNIIGINNYDLWIESMILLNNKWKNKLPQYAGVLMDEEEIKIRESYLESYFELILNYNDVLIESTRLIKSKAYRLGKFIVWPLSTFKNKLFTNRN